MKGNEARRIKSCSEMSSPSNLDTWRERTLENKKWFWRSLLLFTALQRLYKYTTLNLQQVYFALRGQDAQTVLMSPGDWQRWWDRQQQLSHTCLFRSISGTGQTCPPIHPQERGGGSEPEQIRTGLSGKDPSRNGLTTHLCQSLHPGPRRWGRTPPPQEAEDED